MGATGAVRAIKIYCWFGSRATREIILDFFHLLLKLDVCVCVFFISTVATTFY